MEIYIFNKTYFISFNFNLKREKKKKINKRKINNINFINTIYILLKQLFFFFIFLFFKNTYIYILNRFKKHKIML